ncbi:hypothetical protein OH76DRAFT_1196775 [Lentinus brumalis]|uniref:Uncharacterized protein n=1 Tax=Lentinus brumalis TaxID=2498619 RepID=A0A371CT99_9APHY|nr:hypothetical protein OH76DRAFT_1196775 [Polyporus brumalis]
MKRTPKARSAGPSHPGARKLPAPLHSTLSPAGLFAPRTHLGLGSPSPTDLSCFLCEFVRVSVARKLPRLSLHLSVNFLVFAVLSSLHTMHPSSTSGPPALMHYYVYPHRRVPELVDSLVFQALLDTHACAFPDFRLVCAQHMLGVFERTGFIEQVPRSTGLHSTWIPGGPDTRR